MTTRWPARFSWSTVFRCPISVRSAIQLRRISSIMVAVRNMMKGTKTRLISASFQLEMMRMTLTPNIRSTIYAPRIKPPWMNIRTPSTSAVARDIRSPDLWLSWKPKLRRCNRS